METLLRDLRYAFATVRRHPAFSGLVVLMLALGIGASTAIFSVVDGVLLRPLPYKEASRLVYLGTTWGAPDQPTFTSVPDFIDWKDRITTLERIAASQPTSLVLTGGGEPERVTAARISPDLLPLLGVSPALGRPFTSEEHVTDAEPVAILTHGFWQRRWGGDPAVIGTSFTGSRRQTASYRVVGILPAGFKGPVALGLQEADLLLPLELDAPAYAGARDSRSLRVIGRLKPGISMEVARQEIDSLSAAMVAEHPEVNKWKDVTLGIGIVSLREMTVGRAEKELLILLAASGVLLLIACANVANLLLARTTERGREIAVRSALGAGRRRIFGQLLTESVFFSLLGCVAGIWLAMLGVEAFATVGPRDFPRMAEVGVDLRALGFAIGLTVITGVLSGLAPAILSSKGSVSEALKGRAGGRVSAGSRSRLRKILIVAETASALILLICAGLLVNSFLRLRGVDPGFDARNVLLMQVGLGPSYDSAERRAIFVRELIRRVGAIPGVRSASSIADPPLGGVMWSAGVRVEGGDPGDARISDTHMVSPGYFATMGIRLLRGRPFTWQDDAAHPGAAIVNQTMARELWPGRDPLGKRIRLSGSPDAPWYTVVGVADDIRQEMASSPQRQFYIPYAQNAWWPWAYIVVRTESEATGMASSMRQALWSLDPAVPFEGVSPMTDRVSLSLTAPRFRTLLLSVFAGAALILAAGGLYGMLLHAVNQRTREVGIRMALGARPADVLAAVVREGMRLAGIGVLLGLAGALAVSRALASLLYDLNPADPATFGLVALTLGAVALLACLLPARRATRVDPMVALRAE